MHHIKSRKQAGDTIVEVMIAIAIISSVLVGAFLVASTSARSVQDSGERSKALQLAQAQVEQIRAYLSSGAAPISGTAPYCMTEGASGYEYKTGVSDSNNCDPAQNATQGAQFRPSFTRNGDIYTVNVTWEGLKGAAKVELVYRSYGA